MRQLTAKPLTTEGFAKYSSYQNLLDTSDLAKKSLLPPFGFYPDIMTTEFGGAPRFLCVMLRKVKKCSLLYGGTCKNM